MLRVRKERRPLTFRVIAEKTGNEALLIINAVLTERNLAKLGMIQ